MAQVDTSTPQTVAGSKLSAEAEEFTPAKFRVGGDVGGLDVPSGGSAMVNGGSLASQPLNNLPRYMTNCYPFVTDQGTRHARPAMAWPGPGRPPLGPGYPAQRMPLPTTGGFPLNAGHAGGPQGFPARPMRPQVFVQRTTFTTGPAPPPQSMVPGAGPNLTFYTHLPPHGPGPGHNPSTHPPGWPPPQPAHYPHGSQYPPGFYPLGPAGAGGDAGSLQRVEKVKDHKTKKKRENMVSIGIQNDCVKLNQNASGKKKSKTRTIILMDAALQTDFSEEIANLTLAEHPNALYQTGSLRESYGGESSSEESEEVDSDSGYSSPMHRRNQACSGTHPATGLYMEVPTVSTISTCPYHGTTASLNYTSSYVQGLVPGSTTSPDTMDPTTMGATPTTRLSYSAVTSGALSGRPAHCRAKTPVSPLALNSHPAPSPAPKVPAGLAKTDPEEVDTTSSAGRKKRRKSRRRKRKTLSGDDVGALSDDHLELYRAASSSNVSRTSTGDDGNLHVEDEEEFPDLGSAATQGNSKTPAQGFSYSEALKSAPHVPNMLCVPENLSPAMISLLQEVSTPKPGKGLPLDRLRDLLLQASPEDLRGVSAEHLLEELGKLSRSQRKRQKRREAVNRKAEEELAEISLEQQVLRELSNKQRTKEQQAPPSSRGGGKRSQQSMVLNFADMLDAAEQKKQERVTTQSHSQPLGHPQRDTGIVANILDSSGATIRRGKEREVPKPKKPSPLKKVILKEREEKKRMRLLAETGMETPASVEGLESMEDSETPDVPPTSENEFSQDEPSCCSCVSQDDVSGTALDAQTPEGELPEETIPVSEHSHDVDPESPHLEPCDVTSATPVILMSPPAEVPMSAMAGLHPAAQKRLFRYPKLDGWVFPYTLVANESDQSHDGGSSKASSAEQGTCTPLSADMSPISQTSPISMSPLSPGGSPLSSGLTSPISNNAQADERRPSVLMRIHSRRFREYCTQVLDEDIDASCTALLQDLVRFQDRLYHKDPIKAKSRRRIVLGLREVTKHLKLRKIKCVIISPNLERIQSKGGLDDALNNIITTCQVQSVPCVFALGRRALGRACAKLVPVSVVGIFNYEGSEENFKKLMALTEQARAAYNEMVSMMEKEVAEYRLSGSAVIPSIYSHLGHSRTPSACSAISFTSSILSEPISENYPHSEPETDSRGYEISKPEEAKSTAVVVVSEEKACNGRTVLASEGLDSSQSGSSQGKNISAESYDNEADDEADDEDNGASYHGSVCDEDEDEEEEEEEDGEGDRDTLPGLPHIDSMHSSVADLSTELLSQHSSKTIDLTTEALSTHSSRTMADGSTAPPTSGEPSLVGERADSREAGASSPSKFKTLDKERIEMWVAETKQQLERLSLASPDTPSNPSPNNPMCTPHLLDSPAVSNLADYDSSGAGCCSVCENKKS